jgi:catecholate siderophore receptor
MSLPIRSVVNATSLREVLRNTPGITMSIGEGGSGGTSSGDNVLIRGFSARNDIYVDGARDIRLISRDAFNEVDEVAGRRRSRPGADRPADRSVLSARSPVPRTSRPFVSAAADYKRTTLDANHRMSSTVRSVQRDVAGHGLYRTRYRRCDRDSPSLVVGMGSHQALRTLAYMNNLLTGDSALPDVAINRGIAVNDLNFSNFTGSRRVTTKIRRPTSAP